MTAPDLCARCGANLSVDSVGGLCPRCLVRIVRVAPPDETSLGAASSLEPPAPLAPLAQTFGDYELLAETARGGMGVVWRARQINLHRIVALKLILAGRFASAADIKRFRAEAETAAQLDHPNIVPIYDVGEREGQHYFAMKFIEGGSLAGRIFHRQSPFADREAAGLLAKLARAVHYAHQRGLLHRDLKPGNILLDPAGEPHVTDFGLAKRLTDSQLSTLPPHLTVSGAVLGTPSYMSPEAASGKVKALTTATDIYSLGAILYELLAGRPPFIGESTVEILRRVVEEEPVPPNRWRTVEGALRIDRDLETICLKCLEKDAARRYGSAIELAEDLERFLGHEPIRARPARGVEKLWFWCRRHPAVVVAWITFTAALVGALFAWQSRREGALKEEALRIAKAQLANQTVSLVRAARVRAQPGRRVENLPRLAAAAQFASTLDLRNEAAACLALFDLRAGQEFPIPHRNVNRSFTPDLGHFALARDANTINVYELASGHREASLAGWEGQSGWLQFSPDARWFGARWYDGVTVFDFEHQEKVLRLQGKFGGGPEREFAFAPNQDRIAVRMNLSGSPTNEAVDVLELPSGRRLHHWTGLPPELIYGLAYSPDGTKLAVLQRTWLTVLDATNGARVWSMARDVVGDRAAEAYTFAWHPRGDWLLVADKDRSLSAWRLVPVPWRVFFGAQSEQPSSLLFGPDGDWFVSSSDAGESVVWNFHSMQLMLRLEGRYQATMISPDRHRIGYVREPGGRPVAGTWEATPSPVWRELWMESDARLLTLSADGQWLATSAGSNGFHVCHTANLARRADAWHPTLAISELIVAPEQGRVFTRSPEGWWRWPFSEDREWMDKTLAVTLAATPAALRRFLPANAADAGPQRVSEVPTLPGAGRSFGGPELSFQLAGGRRWQVACAVAPTGNTGRFAVAEKAGLLAYTHAPNLVRLLDAHTGSTLCDLAAPNPQRVLDLSIDTAGNTLAVLAPAGLAQVWDLAQLRRELTKLGLDWGAPPSAR